MNALIVYESMYGNTRALAEAVAEELGGVLERAREWAVALAAASTPAGARLPS